MLDIELSNQFIHAFTFHGGRFGECECGKTHVAMLSVDESDPEDREMFEWYVEQAKKDKNIVLNYEDINTFDIIRVENKEFVDVCPCRGWERYMNWILNHRMQIKDFLIGVSDEVERVAELEKTFKVLKDTTLV